jgi:hypothetical protein
MATKKTAKKRSKKAEPGSRGLSAQQMRGKPRGAGEVLDSQRQPSAGGDEATRR